MFYSPFAFLNFRIFFTDRGSLTTNSVACSNILRFENSAHYKKPQKYHFDFHYSHTPLASSLASLAAAAASLETYRQRASKQGGGQAERRLADGRQAGGLAAGQQFSRSGGRQRRTPSAKSLVWVFDLSLARAGSGTPRPINSNQRNRNTRARSLSPAPDWGQVVFVDTLILAYFCTARPFPNKALISITRTPSCQVVNYLKTTIEAQLFTKVGK